MRRQPRSLEDYLLADAGLARYSSHARRLLELQRRFQEVSPLAVSARVANLKFGRVIILAENGAVATKLRQITPRLVDAFRTAAAEVTGIDIRVQPVTGNPFRPATKPVRELGSRQKQVLTSFADGLPEGSPLRAALCRFVDRAKVR
jgi:hypothetical protein